MKRRSGESGQVRGREREMPGGGRRRRRRRRRRRPAARDGNGIILLRLAGAGREKVKRE